MPKKSKKAATVAMSDVAAGMVIVIKGENAEVHVSCLHFDLLEDI